MKVLFLTGSHPRHLAMANELYRIGVLKGLIIEQREAHVPTPPEDISEELKELFVLHFDRRKLAEERFFGSPNPPEVETLFVARSEINSEKVHNFIRKINPDVLLSYGVHKLSPETLNSCSGKRWNIHGGLSPWYRGVITHFWPSYFLEPQMTGMTIHELTQDIDGGPLVHQSAAQLVKDDGIHDLACRAVISLKDDLEMLFSLLEEKGELPTRKQKTTGRIWISKDWRPEHLIPIYKFYNDRIVNEVLKGNIKGREPKLYRQF